MAKWTEKEKERFAQGAWFGVFISLVSLLIGALVAVEFFPLR